MNIYIHIAKRFLSSVNDTGRFTSIISIVGICIGSFALVISISVLNGFENKLDEKISNFEGHLKISGLNQNYDLTKFRTIESITDLSFSSDRKGIIKNNINEAIVTFKQLDFDKLIIALATVLESSDVGEYFGCLLYTSDAADE